MPRNPVKPPNIPNDVSLAIKQFLNIFDFLKLGEFENFVFRPELFKSFEKLDFPNWKQYYPIHENSKVSPLSSINDLEKDLPFELKDDESILRESPIIHQLKNLGNKASVKGDEVYLNKKQAELLLSCYAYLNFILCVAIFGESPINLFKNAKKGDQEAILQLIQLDKSLIESNWSMKEIKRAHLSGDKGYFKRLSKALISDSFKPKKKNLKLTLVLVYGWELGLNKLTNQEIFEFVKDLGIYGSDDPDSLNRELNRLGLRKRNRKPSK